MKALIPLALFALCPALSPAQVADTWEGTRKFPAQTLRIVPHTTGDDNQPRPRYLGIGGAVRKAIHDARTSYQIGYYPAAENWDNKFHKFRVTCSRKGVRIQAKTSYYAWREEPGSKSEQAIDSVVPTTFGAAEIGLRGTLSPIPNSGRTVCPAARIDAQDVVLVHSGDMYNGQLRLAVVGYALGMNPQRMPTIPQDLHYSAQERDRALRQGIGFVQDVTLPENVRTVRLIVVDRSSNAIGSVTMPVPPAASTKDELATASRVSSKRLSTHWESEERASRVISTITALAASVLETSRRKATRRP